MRLVPVSNGEDNRPLVEFNACHDARGRFCAGGARTGWARFEAQSLANLAATSRTAKGINDVSAGGGKKPKLAVGEGAGLAKKTGQNFREALRIAWDALDRPMVTEESVRQFVEQVAGMVSRGLLKPGEGLWRTWGTRDNIPPEEIGKAMKGFVSELHARLNNPRLDPMETAAWVEQRLDGQIHPFSDGCGRTTKIISAFVLARARHPLPRYRDRESYYQTINQSPEAWLRYYRKLF